MTPLISSSAPHLAPAEWPVVTLVAYDRDPIEALHKAYAIYRSGFASFVVLGAEMHPIPARPGIRAAWRGSVRVQGGPRHREEVIHQAA
jgi:hypothetical protein